MNGEWELKSCKRARSTKSWDVQNGRAVGSMTALTKGRTGLRELTHVKKIVAQGGRKTSSREERRTNRISNRSRNGFAGSFGK